MAEGETVQNIYDEIEIDDMDFEEGKFYYPCPCGDKFQITLVSSSEKSSHGMQGCRNFDRFHTFSEVLI